MAAILDVVLVLYKPGDLEARLRADLARLTTTPAALHTIDNSENLLNLSMAWNSGAAAGMAPYIAFLHSDVVLSKGWQEPLLECLARDKSVGAAVANPARFDLSGKAFIMGAPPTEPQMEAWASWSRKKVSKKTVTYAVKDGDAASFYAVVVRRADFARLHGFDERIRFWGAGHDFQWRLHDVLAMNTVMALGSCVWHLGSHSVGKARLEGRFSDAAEHEHWEGWKLALQEGHVRKWHELSGAERRAVRQDARMLLTAPAAPPQSPGVKQALAQGPLEPSRRPAKLGGQALKITCILTSFNRPNWVRQALASLQAQSHRNFELLVFDDSTRIDIRAILTEFRLPVAHVETTKLTMHERRAVNRLSVNINKGLALAKGDLICFLADDDYYFPGWFQAAASFFAENPSVSVAYGKLIFSTSAARDYTQSGEMLYPGAVIKEPYERVDHNQVIHRQFPIPYSWPETFTTLRNPDAHYFRSIAKDHLFYPIDAMAAVKRLHEKNLQKTTRDLFTGKADGFRE